MAGDFNPYREWLGLDADAAPDHYELLALVRFEADERKIVTAAEQAASRVRSFRPGANARVWSQLLDEIRLAKECLCNSAEKAEYDAALRAGKLMTAKPAAAAETPLPPSALGEAANDLLPPGMARRITPQAQPQLQQKVPAARGAPADDSLTAVLRPEDYLPPAADPQPLAATPYYPAETQEPVGWAAGPSPHYGAAPIPNQSALPMALPVAGQPQGLAPGGIPMARPLNALAAATPVAHAATYQAGYGGVQPQAALDPMAPVADGLPQAVAPHGGAAGAPYDAAGQTANDLSLSSAPSAARFAAQRQRQGTLLLVASALGAIVLVAAVGGTAYVMLNRKPLADQQLAAASTPSSPAEVASSAAQPPRIPAPTVRPQPDAPQSPPVTSLPASPPPTAVTPAPVPSLAAESLTPTPAPAPVPEPTSPMPTPPTPAVVPSPAPAPTPEPPPVTRAEVQALVKALDTAKLAVGEMNFKVADAQLAKAEATAKLPQHKAAVARLKEVGGYVKQFRDALAAASAGMQAGETFKVGGSTQVAFVEAQPDRIILRTAGMNKTYPFNDMPPGLALAISDFKLSGSDPMSRVVKGAYLLVHKRATSDTQEKAKTLWEEAAAAGANVGHLMPFLTESYSDLLKDVPTGEAGK